MQFESRVVSYRAVGTKAGCRQKVVDAPGLGIGMFGHGREDAPCDATNISCLKVLREHHSNNLVIGFATDGRRRIRHVEKPDLH